MEFFEFFFRSLLTVEALIGMLALVLLWLLVNLCWSGWDRWVEWRRDRYFPKIAGEPRVPMNEGFRQLYNEIVDRVVCLIPDDLTHKPEVAEKLRMYVEERVEEESGLDYNCAPERVKQMALDDYNGMAKILNEGLGPFSIELCDKIAAVLRALL